MGFDPKNESSAKKCTKRWSAAGASAPTAPQIHATISAAEAAHGDLGRRTKEFLSLAERFKHSGSPADVLNVISNLEAMLSDVQRMRQEMGSIRPQRATAADMAKYRTSLTKMAEYEAMVSSNLDMFRTFAKMTFGSPADADREAEKLERMFVERGAPFPLPRTGGAGSSESRYVELE
ncbi:hypothetical protein H9P43_006812 [Blastocladiella emersonii ATCC 22665]|nr:hypothetical protein H9P43_006812 [Blastocladiella emersonii ATCC 22665]